MSRESIPVAYVNEVCLPVWAGFTDLILPVVSLTSRDSQHSDLVWPDRRPAAGPQVHPQVPDGPFPAALADPAWVGRGRRTGQALPRLLSHSAATPLGTNHVSYQWLLLYNVSWMCYIPLRESVSGTQKIRHRKWVSHMIRLMDNQCWCVWTIENIKPLSIFMMRETGGLRKWNKFKFPLN